MWMPYRTDSSSDSQFTIFVSISSCTDSSIVICSMKVPTRLLSADNRLHDGATAMLVDVLGSTVVYTFGYRDTGVSVEISVSFLDTAHLNEEIEIEAKALRVGKTMVAVTVKFRRKSTGKTIALGRHTKYIAAAPTSSKL